MAPAAEHEGALAEFGALRHEIDENKRGQLQTLALQLTTAGAVFGFVLSRAVNPIFLLVLPVSSYLLCGRYVSHHFGVVLAAAYIRDELSPRVPGGLGWEAWVHSDRLAARAIPHRFWRSTLPMLLAFSGSGLLAVAWSAGAVFLQAGDFWHPQPIGLIIVWLVGVMAVCASGWLLVKAALTQKVDEVTP